MKLFSTKLFCKNFSSILVILLLACCSSVSAQTVTIPTSNSNDSTGRQPLGCFYGYERTEALYLNSEIGTTGYITQVAFYVNSLNTPASNTPVVIRMKTTTNTDLSAATYDSASLSATTVWSGNVTSAMLSVDTFITITLSTPFNYTGDNLEVFVETNYGSFGGENWDGKGIRQSETTFNCNQYWSNDLSVPTDLGEVYTFRPNIRFTFGTLCTGTPTPGNTISSSDSVCSGSLFTLSLQNISVGAGLTYQWQTSPDGINNWGNVSGATNAIFTTSQTTLKHYRCNVTCTNSGQTATSVQLPVYMQTFYHCYCTSYAVTTEDTKIDSVKIGTINTGSDPLQCESYSDYTGGSAATLTPGQPTTIHVVNGSCTGDVYGAYLGVYIDLNHNSSFAEANELVYSYGPVNSLNGIPDGTFFLPVTALSGTTGMRIILQEGIATPLSCGTYTRGETEDYLVSISAVAACSGTPNVGTMNSTLYSVCSNEHFTLSLDNYISQSGLSYQWQYTTNLSAWSNGGTSFTWTDSQIVAHYFRCKITCSNGNQFGYSDTIQVTMNPPYECYCASYSTDILSNDTKIDSVQFGTINSGSEPNHCESYTNYTGLTTDLPRGIATPIRIVNGSCDQQFYESFVAVYIDYNHNGVYSETNELAYSGATTGLNSPLLGTINVPLSADTSGITGMRIIIEEGDSVPSPCGLYQFGETEDYTVHIIDAPTCIDPPNPGVAVVSPNVVCADALPVTVSLSLTYNSNGTGQTYQWEQSTDNANWSDLAGETDPTATATINAGSDTMYYRCEVHCGTTLPSESAMAAVKPTPTGNTLSDPIFVFSFPYTDFNNNLSANCFTNDYNGQPSPDVYYRVLTPNSLGWLEASTCNTADLNTVVYILDGNGNLLSTNDDDGFLCTGTEASDSVYSGAFGQTFFIVVEGQSLLEGSYQLDIDFVVANNINQTKDAVSKISLFPNPNNGQFELSFDLKQNINDVATVNITNVIGKVMQEDKVAVVNGKLSKEFLLNELNAEGVYFVNIRVNDLSLNKRFILQR